MEHGSLSIIGFTLYLLLLEDMDHIMEQSRLYTIEEWKKRSVFRRTFASILRIFDIWL